MVQDILTRESLLKFPEKIVEDERIILKTRTRRKGRKLLTTWSDVWRRADPLYQDRPDGFVSIMDEGEKSVKRGGSTICGKLGRRPRVTWFVVVSWGYFHRDRTSVRFSSLSHVDRHYDRYELPQRLVTPCIRSSSFNLELVFLATLSSDILFIQYAYGERFRRHNLFSKRYERFSIPTDCSWNCHLSVRYFVRRHTWYFSHDEIWKLKKFVSLSFNLYFTICPAGHLTNFF